MTAGQRSKSVPPAWSVHLSFAPLAGPARFGRVGTMSIEAAKRAIAARLVQLVPKREHAIPLEGLLSALQSEGYSESDLKAALSEMRGKLLRRETHCPPDNRSIVERAPAGVFAFPDSEPEEKPCYE